MTCSKHAHEIDNQYTGPCGGHKPLLSPAEVVGSFHPHKRTVTFVSSPISLSLKDEHKTMVEKKGKKPYFMILTSIMYYRVGHDLRYKW